MMVTMEMIREIQHHKYLFSDHDEKASDCNDSAPTQRHNNGIGNFGESNGNTSEVASEEIELKARVSDDDKDKNEYFDVLFSAVATLNVTDFNSLRLDWNLVMQRLTQDFHLTKQGVTGSCNEYGLSTPMSTHRIRVLDNSDNILISILILSHTESWRTERETHELLIHEMIVKL